MKLPIKLKLKIKKIIKKPKRVKKVKPVKKGTWKRKIKALDLRIDRLQQQRTTGAVVVDNTQRTCSNCDSRYTGRICPQCGQHGTWSRYTLKQAILNLLDIWGLGSRPMFRTLKELFWRPGYMVRDYLGGHRQFYFPPFKLLALVTVFFISVNFMVKKVVTLICGDAIDLSEFNSMHISSKVVGLLERIKPSGFLKSLIDNLLSFFNFLSNNLLYDWLFFAVFLVFCIWIAFRRVSKYNFVETYIFLVFLLAQGMLYQVVGMLGHGFYLTMETSAIAMSGVPMQGFFAFLGSVLFMIAGLVSTLYTIYGFYILIVDFKQFYGLSWKSSIFYFSYSFLTGFWILLMLLIGMVLISPKVAEYQPNLVMLLVAVLIVPVAFVFANYYMSKNKPHVNRIVTGVVKGSMLSVISTFAFNLFLIENHYTLASAVAFEVLYCVLATGLSVLPIILYKKFHRTWVAFLPLPLVAALLVWQYSML